MFFCCCIWLLTDWSVHSENHCSDICWHQWETDGVNLQSALSGSAIIPSACGAAQQQTTNWQGWMFASSSDPYNVFFFQPLSSSIVYSIVVPAACLRMNLSPAAASLEDVICQRNFRIQVAMWQHLGLTPFEWSQSEIIVYRQRIVLLFSSRPGSCNPQQTMKGDYVCSCYCFIFVDTQLTCFPTVFFCYLSCWLQLSSAAGGWCFSISSSHSMILLPIMSILVRNPSLSSF